VIVATSASMDVRRLTRASSLPQASSLQAFHVRSFMVSRVFPSFDVSPRITEIKRSYVLRDNICTIKVIYMI
jgi:hypothetical protein